MPRALPDLACLTGLDRERPSGEKRRKRKGREEKRKNEATRGLIAAARVINTSMRKVNTASNDPPCGEKRRNLRRYSERKVRLTFAPASSPFNVSGRPIARWRPIVATTN